MILVPGGKNDFSTRGKNVSVLVYLQKEQPMETKHLNMGIFKFKLFSLSLFSNESYLKKKRCFR